MPKSALIFRNRPWQTYAIDAHTGILFVTYGDSSDKAVFQTFVEMDWSDKEAYFTRLEENNDAT